MLNQSSLKVKALSVSMVFFMSSVGLAQTFSGKDLKANEGPCRADREKLCAGIKPGEGRIWKCLTENEAALSQECRDSLKTKAEQRRK